MSDGIASYLLAFVVLVICLDIAVAALRTDWTIVIALIVYYLYTQSEGVKSNFTFIICIIIITVIYLSYLFFKSEPFVERISVWFVLFFTYAGLQALNETIVKNIQKP